jgi:hypothetical protein
MRGKTANKKRIRYKIPTYKKVYSVYQYHRNKYSSIFKKIQALALKYNENIFYKTNPYRVLDLCYKRDNQGKLQHLGDEKQIFRYKALESVLNEIADYILIAYEIMPCPDVLRYLFNRTHLIIYKDENQAELLETIGKPIGIRLKTHITLLKCLHTGMEIENAIKIAREKCNVDFIKS